MLSKDGWKARIKYSGNTSHEGAASRHTTLGTRLPPRLSPAVALENPRVKKLININYLARYNTGTGARKDKINNTHDEDQTCFLIFPSTFINHQCFHSIEPFQRRTTKEGRVESSLNPQLNVLVFKMLNSRQRPIKSITKYSCLLPVRT